MTKTILTVIREFYDLTSMSGLSTTGTSLNTNAHGSVMVSEKNQIMKMMVLHVRDVMWHFMGQQMAMALSTEIATKVFIEAEMLTPCR